MTKGINDLTKSMKKLSTKMEKSLNELDKEIASTKLKIRQGQVKKRPGLSVTKHKYHLTNLLKQRTKYMKKKKNLSFSVSSMNNLIANMKALKH